MLVNIILVILFYNSIVSCFSKNNSLLLCGLVGFSGSEKSVFNMDKIKLLLMLNQDRGKESYGFYTPQIGIIKDTGKVEEALIKDDFNIPNNNMFIGHVRQSTIGASNKNNAHPFHYGNIVLAMNGTLSNHWRLCQDYKLKLVDFDVDSQLLTALINIDQNAKVLTKILGGCALIYTNTTTNRIYCYRNSDRPLYRGNINGSMYMSSIENSLKIIGCKDVKEFKEDTLYEIYHGKIEATFKIKRAIPEVVKNNYFQYGNNSRSSYTFIDFDHTHSSSLVGKWLEPKTHATMASLGSFFEGYLYEVVDWSALNGYDIVVIDNNNKKITCSKFYFKGCYFNITEKSYAFATRDIMFKNSYMNKFCSKGDLVFVNKIEELKCTVTDVINNQEAFIFEMSYLRYATLDEALEYKRIHFISDNDIDTEKNKHYLSDEDYYNSFQEEDYSIEQAVVIEEKDITTNITKFEQDLNNTNYESFEDLIDFCIDNIEDQIADLEECKQSTEGQLHIDNIKLILDSYHKNVDNYIIEEDGIINEKI